MNRFLYPDKTFILIMSASFMSGIARMKCLATR